MSTQQTTQNDAQQLTETTNRATTDKPKKSFFRRHKFMTLSGLFAMSIAGAGLWGAHSVINSNESAEIGRAVGKYYEQVRAEQKILNDKTKQASETREEYKTECENMAKLIYKMAQTSSNQSPKDIMDKACQEYLKHFPNDSKSEVIIEDVQSMKKYFDGNSTDLANVFCYYHLSPEIKFFNRNSEPADVRDGIYRYEIKARRFLMEKHNTVSKSMFDPSR